MKALFALWADGLVVLSCCLLSACRAPVELDALAPGDRHAPGGVHLEVTCDPAVEADFDTALSLLHSFFYEEARRRFLDIAERDDRCAMAWWGVAMTYYHPLWSPPNAQELEAGIAAVRHAKALGAATDLERGFIDAIDAFYRTFEEPGDASQPIEMSCHGPRAQTARAGAFRDSLAELARRHPENLEVAVFHALSLLGTAPPTDRTYANQLLAASILEPLGERFPEHPGIAHYLIHAYDYPALAARGLPAARRYGALAPGVPHAQHMPSHIYTRLGLWRDSVVSNLASAEAARDYTRRHYGGAVWYDELHALDYLVYAYLQMGEDEQAEALVEYVREVERFQEPNFAAAYAVAAIPARYALERRQWKEAAELTVLHPEVVEPFPFAVAHTEFARAVGAARSGDLPRARTAVERLAQLRDALTEPKFQWWQNQVEIQRLGASGWIARAEGDDAEARRFLSAAAALEDEAGLHPVTPGQLLPAHEQLAELLLELGAPEEALAHFQRTLEAFPQRYRAHLGAAHAADRAGRADIARQHYRALLELAGESDERREELAQARRALAEG